jgi:hypothetical protein
MHSTMVDQTDRSFEGIPALPPLTNPDKHEVLTEYCKQKNDRGNRNPDVIDVSVNDKSGLGCTDTIVTSVIAPSVDISKEVANISTAMAVLMDTCTTEEVIDAKIMKDIVETIERKLDKALRPLQELTTVVQKLGGDVNDVQDVVKDIRDMIREIMEVLQGLSRDVNQLRNDVIRQHRFPFF